MNLSDPFHHVLPVHEDLFNGGLYVTHAGWERIEPGESYPKQEHHPLYYWYVWSEGRILPEFLLAHVMSGAGEFHTSHEQRFVSAGDTVFIAPGEWHRHRPLVDTGWQLAWIHFNGGLPSQWMEDGTFGPDHHYPQLEDPGLFLAEFQRLLLKAHAAPTRNSVQLSWQAIGLLSHFSTPEIGQQSSPKATTGDELVDHAVDHIWNFSHGLLDVPSVAQAVGAGRRSLERRFRAAKGHGLLDEIQKCRFTRAAWLLVETDLPVKTIIGRAGFNSHEQMRLTFHKRAGISPEAYRQAKGAEGGSRLPSGQSG